MNTHIPEAYGGPGLGVLDGCIIAEEIAAGCTGIGTAMEANTLAEGPVIVGGSEEQKKRILTPMVETFRLVRSSLRIFRAYRFVALTLPQSAAPTQLLKGQLTRPVFPAPPARPPRDADRPAR